MEFDGRSLPLSPQTLNFVLDNLDVDAASTWAVLTVETLGSGYLADRRPKILFERHWFHRLTDGQFDAVAPDLSNSSAGGYGEGGANQYDRLERAIQLDSEAALKSASWGLGQIMGFNAEKVGYTDVQEMIDAFCDSENQQLGAMAAFVKSHKLDQAMRVRDWKTFAFTYNGSNFEERDYDGKLKAACTRFEVGPLPDLLVRSVQMALTFLGLPNVGGIDGWFGHRTQTALIRFQTDSQLEPTGRPDDKTVAELGRRVGWQ